MGDPVAPATQEGAVSTTEPAAETELAEADAERGGDAGALTRRHVGATPPSWSGLGQDLVRMATT